MSISPNPELPRDYDTPAGGHEGWAANFKLMFDQMLQRLSEHDQLFDDGLQEARGQNAKLVTDAQSAANLALLNAVNNADLLAKQAIRHADLIAADELEEQQSGTTIGTQTAALSNDDLAKITQAVTAAISSILANMASGRPPANTSGAAA
jgi:hypothetical protein